ncbi:MAG TPA: TenA family protein [Mycobacteriales bacterium]|jgi:thiaminase/transcriptional activator TenA|nr:TenA family protein [Mycobacteriales bacterium]
MSPAPTALSGQLWADSADLAQAALHSDFVRGVADGTLPREVFAGYVAQDAHFLLAFVRAYALALAAAPDRETVLAFADLIAGVRDELGLHQAYAASWDAEPVGPGPATLAYTDFLLATAATGGLAATCAAMTPCMRLYAWLGQSLGTPRGPYADWVRTYADPGFAALAARLEALLDTHAEDSPAIRRAYRRAMELELAFFHATGRTATPAGSRAMPRLQEGPAAPRISG